jgi:predicted O-methyltransferase YrrM
MDQGNFSYPQSESDAANKMRQLIMGFRVTQLIHVAAKLGLADLLRAGPQTLDMLVGACRADPRALYRLLRALASLGIFAKSADGAFRLTPMAELLRSDVPASMAPLALLYGEDWLWRSYGRMLHSVRTGEAALEQTLGQPLYEYLKDHPPAAAQFHQAMSAYSARELAAIRQAYDFSGATRVVDIGGGHGVLLAALLQAHAHLSGVLFELPTAIAEARRRLADAGLADRASCVAGDFFTAVPTGGDLYLLKSVLHNWDDAASCHILHSCSRAMGEGARLLVIERVIPTANAPSEAKLFDINMLVVTGGKERSLSEFAALFRSAGLALTRIVETASPLSLIEGVRA